MGEIPAKEIMVKYPVYINKHEPGAIEAEDIKDIKSNGGEFFVKPMLYFGTEWSGDKAIAWKNNKVGNYLEFKIDSKQNEEKNLIVRFTKGREHAKVQLYFNEKKVGDVVDCYLPKIRPAKKINFGKVKVKKGENILKVLITGKNPKASEAYRISIDYIKFKN